MGGLSSTALQVLFFDFVFSGMLAFYDASFGPPNNLISQILIELAKAPPQTFTSTNLNPLQILVGVASFAQWFALELGLVLLLLAVIVPITAVPGVPYLNFIFTFFQVVLLIWGWTLVKPSGGVPT